MMDDPAAIRAVLREHGIEVPDRGRISADHMAAYERIRSGDTSGDGFVGADEPDGGEEDGPDYPPPGEERQPRRPRGPSARARAKSWRDRAGQRKPRTQRKKVKHPRVPVTDLIATGWEMLGRLTQPVSLPVSRTFKLQSPVAGLVLDDAFRGTVVDRILQPLARGQKRGKIVVALAGPPMIVAAMERAQGIENPEFRSMRLNVLGTMLEESMLLWQEVAGDKFEEAAERMAERERDRQDVRKLIAEVIFAPDAPPVCGVIVGRGRDGTEYRCVRPPEHEGAHAVSEDQAAAYAQQMAGV